ncbi:MAG: hypothetical protein F4003_02565 [Acidimicrobiaceae bacterium]|nr:hypothetical protein [Acidimicrobiaceae bacterium]MYC40970.1 hypothetical protein [Acidimicrobiaceae bacterium]
MRPGTSCVIEHDPRAPVIIGVGQVARHPVSNDEIRKAADSVTLMAEAVELALADCGPGDWRARIDTIAVVGGLWRYRDPAALVASECGIEPSRTVHSSFGGQMPIHLLGALSDRVRSGEIDVAVVTCGENNLSRRAQRKLKIDLARRTEPDTSRVENFGPPLDMGDATAIERGAEMPRNSYAVFDSALRHRRGETLQESRDRSAALWAGYAAVAVDNPYAADRKGMTASQIRGARADNRFVSWPYTKAMCANNNVDHAGAIVITSDETADRLGVNADQRVYPQHCVVADDTTSLIGRYEVSTAPGLAAAGTVLQSMIGNLNEVEHIDLYSCFPSMVALTAEVLGIDTDRVLTVTGGLAFAGAPLNFAAGESLIGMVHRLRHDPGAWGFVQGNGGHASKHALATYSTSRPYEPHQTRTVEHNSPVRQAADPDTSGEATLDGVTVEYDRHGPQRAIGLVRFADGTRTWATSTDKDLMRTCTEVECVGQRIEVTSGIFSL